MRVHHLLLIGALCGGCLSDLEPEVGPVIAGQCKNEDSDPETEVSFADEILPMLQMRCGCHDPKSGGSAIDTTAFSIGNHREIMRGGNKSGEKIVIAKDACSSVLVQKCSEAPPFGTRMPISGPYYSSSEMKLLRDWILEGAHDN